jgi:hypothetical protein
VFEIRISFKKSFLIFITVFDVFKVTERKHLFTLTKMRHRGNRNSFVAVSRRLILSSEKIR